MYQEVAFLAGNTERKLTTFHFNPVENPQEVSTKKGVFYKRVQLLSPEHEGDPRRSSLSRQNDAAIINVGGIKYRIPWSTLEEFPLTRLGKLRSCNNAEELLDVCDDYDVSRNEFFFDRSPSAFRSIVTFLAAGKLRLLREMCALSFQEELLYWGVEEQRLEWCCMRKLRLRQEEHREQLRQEEEDVETVTPQSCEEVPSGGEPEESRAACCMRRLRDMVDNPHSGIPGKIFACLSVVFVAITAVTLCISTMPDLREEEERGECSQRCFNIFVLETVCVGWFSLEFLLRFIHTQSKCVFLRTPLNIIDVVAILPYYITLIVDSVSAGERPAGSGNNYLEKVGLVLRVLRALRIFYVMRLARHSLGLQTLGLTVRRCTREFGLLLLFLCVAMALFSPLVFLAESEMGAKQEFTSIPGSYWWAVISMTTVGYGDMVPRSIPGQVVALSSILSGILLMAFPVTSIFHTFSRSYLELKEEQSRAARQRPGSHDSTKSQNSEDSQDTDSYYPAVAAAAEASVAAFHRKSTAAPAQRAGEARRSAKT
ncbi:potassium voltage-gated channel subfamily G member 2 [Denticeps clupeoides]|uniref:Potassium voltage-gated channel subfamily G member 2 n=1 Tax=Denticeps clupeoides TaxID=299321 RepID=A0AAY4CH52_9TELE|nr:potassium voltage-gated channel subfamily G member 2-like [Denticeps clupeoides]XP_028820640.1 potassium voltage-gated channel subfamily G member 2-like [Denticeps clupeoides]XP_028820641.1 potassium voltage-gated channel subfamily G member 2-like [Denticeps clupeoides]